MIDNYKTLKKCPLENYNEMKNGFIIEALVSIILISVCIYYGADKTNSPDTNTSSFNTNYTDLTLTSTPIVKPILTPRGTSLDRVICSEGTCLFNENCVKRVINSYCVKNDPYNAWKCEKGYVDTGTKCIIASQNTQSYCNAYIKGNVKFGTNERIYHLPNCPDYGATKIDSRYGERFFCSEQAARNAGWRKAWNCP